MARGAQSPFVSAWTGELARAYGRGLAALRKPNQDGTPGLDLAAIRASDWVLTTYETLRDYSRDFGAVRFAAMLMDEAQKVKTPGIRMTDAAKAMNADFPYRTDRDAGGEPARRPMVHR